MVSKKPKKKPRCLNTTTTTASQTPPRLLPTIISALQSPQGLNPGNLRGLYLVLLHLSSKEPVMLSSSETNYAAYVKLNACGVHLGRQEIDGLSEFLFKELDKRLGELFSCTRGSRKANLHLGICSSIQELTLLLRCCMVFLILIAAFDQNLLMEKGRVLLAILGRLISVEFSSREKNENGKTKSCKGAFIDASFATSPCDSCYTLLSAVLEVFADELLVHKSLRDYLMLIDSAPSKREMLFACHFVHGNISSVLEVICARVMLSISGPQAFENLVNRIFWWHGQYARVPEISLPAALSLLLNPIMLSAPKICQAYLILIVSEAIGICKQSQNMKLDPVDLDFFITAFKRSIFLYSRHLSSLLVDGHPSGGSGSSADSCFLRSSSELTFESFLQPSTSTRLNHLIAESNKSWDYFLTNISVRLKSDMVASSIAYVKDSLSIFDESHKYEILSVSSSVIFRSSSGDVSHALHKIGKASAQDVYLLASILKLMSCSLLQITWYMRDHRLSGGLKCLKEASACKEYDDIVDSIGCFKQFNIHRPIQTFLSEIFQAHPEKHKKSKWMFMHLLSLLSIIYVSGLEFLVKNCLFTIMASLNFFIIEEGDLSALGSLFSFKSPCFSSKSSQIVKEVPGVLRPVEKVSSKIQKIQKMYLRTRVRLFPCASKHEKGTENSEYAPLLNETEEHAEERCNGEAFLKSAMGQDSDRLPDFDYLADFIECTPGKDYSGWLRARQRFNRWRKKRKDVLRWKKKKMVWYFMKGK